MREFYFRPLVEENEAGDEADGREEFGSREGDEERLAAKTSSSTPRPRARSLWNVDGELITHPAIHIKYERFIKLHTQVGHSPFVKENGNFRLQKNSTKDGNSYMYLSFFHSNVNECKISCTMLVRPCPHTRPNFDRLGGTFFLI